MINNFYVKYNCTFKVPNSPCSHISVETYEKGTYPLQREFVRRCFRSLAANGCVNTRCETVGNDTLEKT